MNKYQEALDCIKAFLSEHLYNCCKEDYDTIQELIDKQIPQKIITDLWEEDAEKHFIVHKCPKCFEIIDKDSEYCRYCGQKLRKD